MKKLSFKKFDLFYDQYLFIAITLLSILGLIFLFSASQGNTAMVFKQGLFVLFGILLMLLISQPDPDFFNNISVAFLLLSIILIIATFFIGIEANGAKRWLNMGFFTLQPSELLKIALPIYLSSYLYHRKLPISMKHTFITLGLILALFYLVASQPDLGTGLVVIMSGLYILFLAGLSWRFIGISFLLMILSLPFLWNNFLEPFQQQRIKTFFNPESDPFGSSWNITQSKIAIGSGGVSGKGYQEGSQSHLDFLPETETDFIFAVIAEEFGFIGVCTLMAIYIFILMRCFYLALNARDRFCRLAIGGLSLIFASTLFMNLGMVTGLLPVVGMPLPFVSKGGSSLLSFYIAFGIIISMASHKKLMQK